MEHLTLFRRMLEIRLFEERVQSFFQQGLVRGSTHLCQGQEAVPVGACAALSEGDTMTCTYRGHGAVLAMGAPLDRAFAEILGKEGGLCGGKGGSMHLTDLSVGALGSFAIVGAHLPFTVGAAFSAAYRRSAAVSIAFFGEGTANIGAFHEALNLAAIWRLPALFVCENNLYGEYSPIATTTPIEQVADRADAYAMAKARVDGNDVLAVRDAVNQAAARARNGDGPTFIEALTYRQVGHSRSDPATYRPPGELEEWLKRDPIATFERRVVEEGSVEVAALERTRNEAEQAVASAADRALSMREPSLATRFEDVF